MYGTSDIKSVDLNKVKERKIEIIKRAAVVSAFKNSDKIYCGLFDAFFLLKEFSSESSLK